MQVTVLCVASSPGRWASAARRCAAQAEGAWTWRGLHLTPSPGLPLPLVPALPGQGPVGRTLLTHLDLAANGYPRGICPSHGDSHTGQ